MQEPELFPLVLTHFPSFQAHSLCTSCCLCTQTPHTVCLGCFAALQFKKVACSNFGELSNAQYSLHGIWCMMFNMNFDGERGGSCLSLQALVGMSSKVLSHLQAWGNHQQHALLALV